MNQDNVIGLKKPEAFIDDQITAIIRQGARQLLAQAFEVEIELFISQYAELKDEIGRQRLVRNGYLPEREIQSGIGPLPVKAPRMRDRHSKRKRDKKSKKRDGYFMLDTNKFLCNVKQKFMYEGAINAKNSAIGNKGGKHRLSRDVPHCP